MDYEKAYKEALERAKAEAIDGYLDVVALETIFPELAESEDERIRKEIRTLYNEIDSCISELLKARTSKDTEAEGKALFRMEGLMVGTLQDLSCIDDYLEKQKEQNPDELNKEYWLGYHEGKRCVEDKFKEQKPAEKSGFPTNLDLEKGIDKEWAKCIPTDEGMGLESANIVNEQFDKIARHFYELGRGDSEKPNNYWSEDYREEDLQTRVAFYTYKDEDGVLYLSNLFVEATSRNKGFGTKILKAADKFAEAIGAISIRLRVKQNSPVNEWYRKNGYGYMTFEDGYDWLEKNLEYLKPKQEWSEEDDDMLESFLHKLEVCDLLSNKENVWAIKKLKSLRPFWKPSEEQMKALEECLLCDKPSMSAKSIARQWINKVRKN